MSLQTSALGALTKKLNPSSCRATIARSFTSSNVMFEKRLAGKVAIVTASTDGFVNYDHENKAGNSQLVMLGKGLHSLKLSPNK